MLVSIGDAFVILLFEFVFIRIRIWIPTAPKLFNEPFTLIIGCELLESLSLFVCDDVSDVLVQPVFVGLFEFCLYIARFVHRILGLCRILSKTKQAGAGQEKGKDGQAKSGFLVIHKLKTPYNFYGT